MFDWNKAFTLIQYKLPTIIACTVGRYKVPKDAEYPYVDVALTNNSGSNYDLDNNEGTMNPTITLEAYSNGTDADSKCYDILIKAKELMLSYGFKCKVAPIKTTSTATGVARWTSRYQRLFASGDELTKLH